MGYSCPSWSLGLKKNWSEWPTGGSCDWPSWAGASPSNHHCRKEVTFWGNRKNHSQRYMTTELRARQSSPTSYQRKKILNNDKQLGHTHLIPQHWKWKICSLFLDTIIWKYDGIYFPESTDHLSNLGFGLAKSGYCPSLRQKQTKQNDSAPFVAWEAKRDTNTHANHMKGSSGENMSWLALQPCSYGSLSSTVICRPQAGKLQVHEIQKSKHRVIFMPLREFCQKRSHTQFNQGAVYSQAHVNLQTQAINPRHRYQPL